MKYSTSLAIASLYGSFLTIAPVAHAQSTTAAMPASGPSGMPANAAALPAQMLVLEAGAGRLIHFAGPVSSVYVADPKVADIKPSGSNSAFVMAIGPGETSIVATDDQGHAVERFSVLVNGAGTFIREASAQIRHALPGQSVTVTADPAGAIISGDVTTASQADTAIAILQGFLTTNQHITNHLKVTQSIQVAVRVRIVEMSRSLTRDLGVNWQQLGGDLGQVAKIGLTGMAGLADAAGGAGTASLSAAFHNTNIEAVIDALSQDQLIRTLAEPNLTAISGQPASFMVGGEFPIPVSGSLGQVNVTFKPYGISLTFVPTVLSNGQINLKVRPEVSQVTAVNAISTSNGGQSLTIPGLTIRRAETTIELGSGQSFAIAGLMQDQINQSGAGTPFLGDVPVLGALFRSDSFKRQQSELVIIVTPYIVRPVDNPHALQTPGADYRPPGDLDRVLLLRQQGVHFPAQGPIPGDAGFVVE